MSTAEEGAVHAASADSGTRNPALVTPDAIEAAARRLAGVVVRTPLLAAPWLAETLVAGAGDAGGPAKPPLDIRLKCENLQRAGAFKIRGAYNTIASLSEQDRRRGVITYSSGNHGQGVALAAKLFGVPAVVVMPTTAPGIKIEGVRGFGGEVVFAGTTSADRYEKAMELAGERGLVVIPPYDDARIIAGQGTVGREILEDFPEVEAVLVPIGGGGLISGIAAWIKRRKPACRVVGVEPELSCSMRRAKDAGAPVTIEPARSIADGLLPIRPGDLNFAHVRELVDDVVLVSEEAIRDATQRLLGRGKLVVEPSGAATVAALLSSRFRPDGPTVAVLSGGNLDPAVLG